MRSTLQGKHSIWEEESKAREESYRLTFDPDDPGARPDNRLTKMSEALDQDALKLKSRMGKTQPSSSLNNIFSTSSQTISETLSTVTDFVPRLPFYLSNAASKVLAKKETTESDQEVDEAAKEIEAINIPKCV